jgi:ABC-2 type transport system ATP-binding protein
VLPEIAQVASRVMILLDGTLLTTDALRHGGDRRRLRLAVDGSEAELRACLGAVAGVRAVSARAGAGDLPGCYIVEADERPFLARDIAAALTERRLALSELTPLPPDLEHIFLELTRRRDEAAA